MKAQNHVQSHPCPNCGYCPHCGRGGYRPYPYYWYPHWYPTWGGTIYNGTVGSLNSSSSYQAVTLNKNDNSSSLVLN